MFINYVELYLDTQSFRYAGCFNCLFGLDGVLSDTASLLELDLTIAESGAACTGVFGERDFVGVGVLGGSVAVAGLAVSSPYRVLRLTSFMNPWANQFDSGYQLTQSLIAFDNYLHAR